MTIIRSPERAPQNSDGEQGRLSLLGRRRFRSIRVIRTGFRSPVTGPNQTGQHQLFFQNTFRLANLPQSSMASLRPHCRQLTSQ